MTAIRFFPPSASRQLLRCLALVLVLAIGCVPADAQRRRKSQRKSGQPQPARSMDKVKKEQTATQLKISETATRLNTTGKELNRQLTRLNTLNADIEVTKANVGRIKSHIDSIGSEIHVTTDSIAILERDLENLRKGYADALRQLQPTSRQLNTLSFIFSSKSFAEAWARVRYLRRFSQWRQRKADEIGRAIDRIADRRQHLAGLRNAQDKAYRRAEQERLTLARQQEESRQLVDNLRKENTALRAQLAEQKRRAAALDRELDRLIAAEQARIAAEEKARRKKEEAERRKREAAASQASPGKRPSASPKPSSAPSSSGGEVRLASDFAKNKGRLPWPDTGNHRVYRKFGRQPHPTLKHVETDNAGIDIMSSVGAGVNAVFDGTVSAIFRQDGFNSIVMLRHGAYLTVYAGLGSVSVSRGQKVKAGQNLGTVTLDAEGNPILHFEIRNERTKLNPSLWLR